MRKNTLLLWVIILSVASSGIWRLMLFRASLPRNISVTDFGPVEFSNDGHSLVLASSLSRKIFNLDLGQWKQDSLLIDNNGAEIYSYVEASRGESGLMATSIGTFLVQSNKSPERLSWSHASAPAYAIAMSSDGKLIAGGHTLGVWVTNTGVNQSMPYRQLWKDDDVQNPPAVLKFSPDNQLLAIGYFTGRVEVKDARTGKTVWFSKKSTAFSSTGLSYFPIDPRGKAAVLTSFGAPSAEKFFFPMTFLSNQMLAYNNGRTTLICDAKTGKSLHALPRTGVYALSAFSRGRTLVLAKASKECEIELWDTKSGQLQRVLPRSRRALYIAVSPDEKYIAALEDVNGLKIWTMK